MSLTGDATIKFKLAIQGQNFGDEKDKVTVQFATRDPAHPVTNVEVKSVIQKEILVEAQADSDTEITKITATVAGHSVASPKDLTVSIKPNPPAKETVPAKFEIKLDHETNKEFPNLHTLIVTKQSGDGGFGSRVNHIALELVPAGATALKIEQISNEQLHLSFVAAADYVPKSLSVTVYDSSDLDTRAPQAVATPAPEPSKTDPNEPKIERIETVFLDRSQGNGRIRIFGTGFGTYDPPEGMPFLAESYLNCDVERPYIYTQPVPGKSETDLKKIDRQRQIDDRKLDPRCDSFEPQKAKFEKWATEVRSRVEPGIRSREDALDVERIEILYMDDKVADLYFEFFRRRGSSEPFRLESATLSIRRNAVSVTQTVKSDKVTGQISEAVETVYALSQTIGAQPNPNLSYSYSILDTESATPLFGAGVAQNFYVVKLSVVNNGSKKVSIPLASIQAEAEWARGTDRPKRDNVVEYYEGPPTVSPVPLAAVSAYFSSDYKVTGGRARFFNALDGVTTLAAAIVPFAGPGFKAGNAVFTAGFVPGVHKFVGDLSDQQLQTLTGQSWQSSETIAANGGSVDKFVYIQRNEQFSDKPVSYDSYGDNGVTRYRSSKQIKKKLTNIIGLEVTGTEIQEGAAGTATSAPAPQNKPTAGNNSPTPTAPSATPPAEPPKPPKKKS